jgi:hypothetical protein
LHPETTERKPEPHDLCQWIEHIKARLLIPQNAEAANLSCTQRIGKLGSDPYPLFCTSAPLRSLLPCFFKFLPAHFPCTIPGSQIHENLGSGLQNLLLERIRDKSKEMKLGKRKEKETKVEVRNARNPCFFKVRGSQGASVGL